jgi:hypothetical protein
VDNKIWNKNSKARMVNYSRASSKEQEANNSLTIQLEAYERDLKSQEEGHQY